MDMAGACVPTSSVALCFPGERRKKASLLSNPLFLLSSAWKRAFEIRSCASNFDQCGEEEEEGILFLPLSLLSQPFSTNFRVRIFLLPNEIIRGSGVVSRSRGGRGNGAAIKRRGKRERTVAIHSLWPKCDLERNGTDSMEFVEREISNATFLPIIFDKAWWDYPRRAIIRIRYIFIHFGIKIGVGQNWY